MRMLVHTSGAARARFLQGAFALLCLALPWFMRAQVAVQEGSTLHVSSTLLQIPVLILSNKHQPVPTIPAGNFTVTLGKDAPFRPQRVRLEGDDPITLAVLLDASFTGSLLPNAVEGLVAMVRDQLRPHDRVAVYAMNGCVLLRMNSLGTVTPEAMRSSAQRAAAIVPYNAYARDAVPCPRAVGLWDATDYLARTLAAEPGRRVVLAVTNGYNHVGVLSADLTRRDVNHDGVAVFAVAERYKVPSLGPVFPQVAAGWRIASLLNLLTEGSGGMIVESTRNDVAHALTRFVELLRGRYIIEFQRPASTVAGTNIIDVRCGLPKAFVRPAGTSMPIADPATRDPSVQQASAPETEVAAPAASAALAAPLQSPAAPSAPAAVSPAAAPVPVAAPAVDGPVAQHNSPLDITDESVPVAAPLPAGTAVK